MRLTPLQLSVALATVTACALALPVRVEAHARYESSSPAKGEILAISPNEVEIAFTQDIQRIAGKYDIEVLKDRGPSVTSGPAVVDDEDRTKMSVPLQPGLAEGRYVVNWNNVSDEDGDPAEGAFSFYVNHEPNTVDLENDRQLEQIGAEGTPMSETPAPGETPSSNETPPAGESPANTPAASPTVATGGGDDGGDDTSVILIVVGAIAVAAVLAGGGYFFLRGRGT